MQKWRSGTERRAQLRFYTKEECEEWLRGRERTKPDAVPDIQVERIGYPTEPHRIFSMAHWIASSLTFRMPTLLWITEWSVWPSSENWHLFTCSTNCVTATETCGCFMKRRVTCFWSTNRKTSHPSCKSPC